MGRVARGVRGIRLRDGDEVIGAGSSNEGGSVLSITEKGFGKRTLLENYRVTARGGLGVTSHRLSEKTGPVAAVKLVTGDEDILVITDDGTMIRVAADAISQIGRSTGGVRVMRPVEGSRVIDIEKTEREESAEHVNISDAETADDGEELPDDEELEEEEELEAEEDLAEEEDADEDVSDDEADGDDA